MRGTEAPRGGAPDPDPSGALEPAEITTTTSSGQPGWTVVVRGEVDIATSPLLRGQLTRLVTDDVPIVVDVTEMTFIDSSGLGVLVEMLQRRRETGRGGMALHGMQEPVRRVFEITGLTDLFEVD
jgi:anti-sigma B factor antagonist